MEKGNTHSCLAFNETHSQTLCTQKLRISFSYFDACKLTKKNGDLQSQIGERMGVGDGILRKTRRSVEAAFEAD